MKSTQPSPLKSPAKHAKLCEYPLDPSCGLPFGSPPFLRRSGVDGTGVRTSWRFHVGWSPDQTISYQTSPAKMSMWPSLLMSPTATPSPQKFESSLIFLNESSGSEPAANPMDRSENERAASFIEDLRCVDRDARQCRSSRRARTRRRM